MCIYHIETNNKIQASNSREKMVISPKKRKGTINVTISETVLTNFYLLGSCHIFAQRIQ